ncbi:hypothetical protein U9M48_032991 [Paspalum notatum var. saurae]|uniref:Uncharacterized protein n=1 Tax=Paspalum notatum var. saurae TaxID=547442 RepID=A0AAQ3U5V6_PASNO
MDPMASSPSRGYNDHQVLDVGSCCCYARAATKVNHHSTNQSLRVGGITEREALLFVIHSQLYGSSVCAGVAEAIPLQAEIIIKGVQLVTAMTEQSS